MSHQLTVFLKQVAVDHRHCSYKNIMSITSMDEHDSRDSSVAYLQLTTLRHLNSVSLLSPSFSLHHYHVITLLKSY